MFQSSYSGTKAVLSKIGVLKISQYCQENTCVGVCNFTKKRLKNRSFPVNIAIILGTAVFTEHLVAASAVNCLVKRKL